jgi:hypothetical protein
MTGSGAKIFFILSGQPHRNGNPEKKSFEDAAYSSVRQYFVLRAVNA